LENPPTEENLINGLFPPGQDPDGNLRTGIDVADPDEAAPTILHHGNLPWMGGSFDPLDLPLVDPRVAG